MPRRRTDAALAVPRDHPFLSKMNGRTFPLSALPLGEMKLRDLASIRKTKSSSARDLVRFKETMLIRNRLRYSFELANRRAVDHEA